MTYKKNSTNTEKTKKQENSPPIFTASSQPNPITMNLLDWFDLHRRSLPWRQLRTPYRTWISEIMLQQTKVATAIPYFQRFIVAFPDIPSLATAPLDEVYKFWEGLGYYSRARNLHKGAQLCINSFQGQLPNSLEQLMLIPGVGSYTAGAIASLAFHLPVAAIDGNVIRVFSRLFGLSIYTQEEKSKREVEKYVLNLLPPDRCGDFNEAIMDLGAMVCTPKAPQCELCPLQTDCQANALGLQLTLPLRKNKKDIPTLPYTIVILKQKNKIFLQKRPQTGLLANLFEFISFPKHLKLEDLYTSLFSTYNIPASQIKSYHCLPPSTHVFSHLKWDMRGYLIELSENEATKKPPHTVAESTTPYWEGQFIDIEEAKKSAFPSALKTYTAIIFNFS